MTKFVIDRIEDDFCVLEDQDKKLISIEKSKFPDDIIEGDIVIFENGEYVFSKELTEKAREEMFKLQESLFE